MRVKENYGRDAPSRIPAVRLELSEMRGRRFMAEIQLEKTALGLELGSTRIKAVLIGPEHAVLASGAHDWENRLEHGYWTYALDDVWAGVQDAFARLARQVQERYGTPLHTVGAMGVSGMMHGYLPFARDGAQLAAFRTWRNTTTERAAALLTERFAFNVPQRWSVAHLYQAILDGEPHARDIAYLTTLAGYVHWRLTGERVLGVGEASGMFPIDSAACGYDAGMAATNSVGVRTGNVSAGTSVFAMAVLERPLARVYPEIDMVTTPTGRPVAMVHCNTCTSDLDAWVRVLGEMAGAAGAKLEKPRLYDLFYQKALEGEADCGGLVSYNYYSGEPVTGVESGRPLFMRRPDARFTLANFARVQLYAAMATLKLGMDILLVEEGVRLDTLLGHGGLFKTPVAGQKLLAGALGVPVAVMETAGEGGPWGMALLAAYCVRRAEGQTLEEYLADTVFRGAQGSVQQPDAADTAGFARFLTDYKSGLAVEKAAAAALR